MTRTPKSSRMKLASLGLASLLACEQDPFDELDPNHIDDLGNDMGDAKGESHSGLFATELAPLDCDCPALFAEDFPGGGAGLGLEPGQQVDPCTELALFYGIDGPVGSQAELVQTDGLLAWTSWLPALSGPIDADGSFSVGGSEDFSETFVEAKLVSRVDGEFSDTDTFVGVMQQRIIARLLDRDVDCRSTHQVNGERLDVPN